MVFDQGLAAFIIAKTPGLAAFIIANKHALKWVKISKKYHIGTEPVHSGKLTFLFLRKTQQQDGYNWKTVQVGVKLTSGQNNGP